MQCLMKWTRPTWRLVRVFNNPHSDIARIIWMFTELDALAQEEEEEGPSYLADLNKAPDFIDEPPVEVGEVRIRKYCFPTSQSPNWKT